MASESDLVKRIRVALSKIGVKNWRNNVGVLQDKFGNHIRYGLCNGSSDIIGIAPDGRFVAIEVKLPNGKIRPEQQNFIDQVRKSGGIAGVARSEEDAIALFSPLDNPPQNAT